MYCKDASPLRCSGCKQQDPALEEGTSPRTSTPHIPEASIIILWVSTLGTFGNTTHARQKCESLCSLCFKACMAAPEAGISPRTATFRHPLELITDHHSYFILATATSEYKCSIMLCMNANFCCHCKASSYCMLCSLHQISPSGHGCAKSVDHELWCMRLAWDTHPKGCENPNVAHSCGCILVWNIGQHGSDGNVNAADTVLASCMAACVLSQHCQRAID